MEEKEETGKGHLKIFNMVLKDFYEIKMAVLWMSVSSNVINMLPYKFIILNGNKIPCRMYTLNKVFFLFYS